MLINKYDCIVLKIFFNCCKKNVWEIFQILLVFTEFKTLGTRTMNE